MSDIMDFLFEGKPPPSVTSYGSTTENMPRWLSDYTQGVIGRANAVAAEPYQPYAGPRLAPVTPDQQQGYDLARGTVGQASQNYGTLMQSPTAMQAAQPYVNQASQNFPGNAAQYMNPYVENVIGRSTTLANRALNEKFLPSLAGTFGSRGQDARSSAYKRQADRGVRDLTEGLQEQAGAQLGNAWQAGAQTFTNDQARQAQLAGTVGNLANTDRTTGNTLIDAQQRSGLLGSATMDAVGRDQQADTQRSLDLAKSDFNEQRDYPRSTIDWMNSVVRGLPYSHNTTTAEQGPANIVGPSPISQAGSLATGIAGLMNAFRPGTQKRRGGAVRKKKRRGTLSYARYKKRGRK